MPTTRDWYYAVVLRHFFDGRFTDEQWTALVQQKSVTSPESPQRMKTVSNREREWIEPSTYDLPLIRALDRSPCPRRSNLATAMG